MDFQRKVMNEGECYHTNVDFESYPTYLDSSTYRLYGTCECGEKVHMDFVSNGVVHVTYLQEEMT